MKHLLLTITLFFACLSVTSATNLESAILGMWQNEDKESGYYFAKDNTGEYWRASRGVAIMTNPNGIVDKFKWAKTGASTIELSWINDSEWNFNESKLDINVVDESTLTINGKKYSKKISPNDKLQEVLDYFSHPLGMEADIRTYTKSKFEKFLINNGIGYESKPVDNGFVFFIKDVPPTMQNRIGGIYIPLYRIEFYDTFVAVDYGSWKLKDTKYYDNFIDNFLNYANIIKKILSEAGFTGKHESYMPASCDTYHSDLTNSYINLTIDRPREEINLSCILKYE